MNLSLKAAIAFLALSGTPAQGNGGSSSAVPDDRDDIPQVRTSYCPKVAAELVPLAQKAREAFDRGRYADAESLYNKLLARDPSNSYLLANQGVVLFREDKLTAAEAMLEKAMALDPKDAVSEATLGITYYHMHRYDDALRSLTRAIQLDPQNAVAHNYLGIASDPHKGWPAAAIEEASRAIESNPNYGSTLPAGAYDDYNSNNTIPNDFGSMHLAQIDNANATITPIVLHDAGGTGNYYYVESDGRHVTAFTQNGKILWHRDPFVDGKLEPFRYSHPTITELRQKPNSSRQLFIKFNSTQYGNLDAVTGDFTPGG